MFFCWKLTISFGQQILVLWNCFKIFKSLSVFFIICLSVGVDWLELSPFGILSSFYICFSCFLAFSIFDFIVVDLFHCLIFLILRQMLDPKYFMYHHCSGKYHISLPPPFSLSWLVSKYMRVFWEWLVSGIEQVFRKDKWRCWSVKRNESCIKDTLQINHISDLLYRWLDYFQHYGYLKRLK